MKKTIALLAGVPALFFTSAVFAEGADAAQPQGSFMQTLIMIGVALLFFYFILWRPEQKRRKTMDQQRNSMKPGDKVTAMGIVGTVSKVQETTVILKMVDGAKIEVLKAAITDVQPSTSESTTTIEAGESK
jgi:preprotein translocase subunit YajC